MDTAITWCRDAGWDPSLIEACHFYPSVGSVFYLSDDGGPTAVFNQSTSAIGLNPLIPNEIGLIYPKKNQQLLFKGTRYHGVLHPPAVQPSQNAEVAESVDTRLLGNMDAHNGNTTIRKTLLINYWGNDRKAGESVTLTLSTELEQMFMDRLDRLMESYYATIDYNKPNADDRQNVVQPTGLISDTNAVSSIGTPLSIHPVHNYNTQVLARQVEIPVSTMNFNFLEDFVYWKQQLVPPRYDQKQSMIYKFANNPLNDVLNNSMGNVYMNWVHWYPRNLTKEYIDQVLSTANTNSDTESSVKALTESDIEIPRFVMDMYAYVTAVTVNVPITEEDRAMGKTPKHILGEWRAGMPGGNPFPVY